MQLVTLLWFAEDFMLPCLNKKIFGIDCPGCGMQRSVGFLLKGEFLEAFLMYPAVYTIIPLLGLLLVDNFFKIKYINKTIITLLISSVVLILGNYVLKFL